MYPIMSLHSLSFDVPPQLVNLRNAAILTNCEVRCNQITPGLWLDPSDSDD